MKTIKTIFKIFLLFILIVSFFLIKRSQSESQLEEVAQPFMKACQSSNGCIVNPESLGWIKEPKHNCKCSINSDDIQAQLPDSYSKNSMEYVATIDKFTITWRTATDTDTVATGGKSIPLTIVTIMEE